MCHTFCMVEINAINKELNELRKEVKILKKKDNKNGCQIIVGILVSIITVFLVNHI